jgi:uncharacterized membrane protein
MVAYHFCFDLALFRLIDADFYRDRFWLVFRTVILGQFLLLAGISLHFSATAPRFAERFRSRLAVIAASALAVSTASYVVFPRSWIYFGVLHAIAVSLLLCRPLARRPRLATALGGVVVLLGNFVAHPVFDPPWANWIGFATRKPPTEDYVPLFPWLGLVLVGVGLGAALRARPPVLATLDPRAPRALALLGRHSLAVYLLHQPLLIGALWLLTR